jgi:spore germination protein (amino acid permease)
MIANNTEQITKSQLFSLIVMFEVGTTTLFAINIKAKQDAWVATLIAMLIGMTYLLIFTEIQKAYPNKNFIEIIIAILGKGFGIPVSLIYAFFFIYPSARNMRHVAELNKMTILPQTPLIVILAILMFVQLYIFFLGIKVFARTSEIMMPIFIFFIISIYLLSLMSGEIHIKNMLPILGNGYQPLLKALFPVGISFPFSEMFVFTMYWKYIPSIQVVRNTSIKAVIFSSIILTITSILTISVLGVKYTASSSIPFLEVIKLINIKDIITNLDAIGVILIFVGGLYKTSIYFYACINAFATVFNVKNNKKIAIPLGIFILWYSTFSEPNYPFLLWMTEINAYFILIPLIQVAPCLLLTIYWLKKRTGKLKEISN